MAKVQRKVVKARGDEKGTVKILIFLIDANGARIKGNVSRTFKVNAQRVSDVARAAEMALLERPYTYSLKTL